MTHRARLTVVVVAAAAGAVGFVVFLSLDPDSYFFYTPEDRAARTFSPWHVALVCCVMVAEAVIWAAALISRRPKFLWLRSLLALIVLVPWGLFTIQIAMHAPRYVRFHHLWLWFVILSLVIAAIASGTMHAISLARQRRARHARRQRHLRRVRWHDIRALILGRAITGIQA